MSGWVWWALAYLFTPVVAIVMLTAGGSQVGAAWAAAHGGGQVGTLHITDEQCSHHRVGAYRCTGLYGDYISADGATQFHHAFLEGVPEHAAVGSDVAVRSLGDHNGIVYKADKSREWLLITAGLVAAVLALGVWGAAIYARTHGRYLPLMTSAWTKPPVKRDKRAPGKTGHRRRRRKKR